MRLETQTIQIKEDGDIVSVTLPPSNHTRTVVITRSRPFSDHVSILENQPIGPPTLIYLSRLSAPPSDVNVSTTDDITVPNDKPLALSFETATRPEVVRAGGNSTPTAPRPPAIESDVTTISASMDMLALEGRVSPREAVNPVSQTASPPSHLRECSPGERFHVSEAVRFKYPPLAVGWKGGRCWVVVIRGRDVGVFHDFWARIWPLIKNSDNSIIPGAHWRKAEDEADALKVWASAVEGGGVDRI